MKIAVNRCFGGFSLSNAGTRDYLRRKGKDAYFYKQTKYSFKDGKDEYTRITDDSGDLFSYTTTRDLGETFSGNIPEDCFFYLSGYKCRTDPDLLATVESLGEKACSNVSKIEIIEIPDGIDYEIDEYDGVESVHEKQRSW
jgi:hypothetical protein